jgi:hypothetical protein
VGSRGAGIRRPALTRASGLRTGFQLAHDSAPEVPYDLV